MVRRIDPTPTADTPDPTDPVAPPSIRRMLAGETGTPTGAGPNLAAFPVIGLTRRRMAAILGVVLAAWIVILFARQVGDASAASSRAEAMVAANAGRRSEIDGLERELGQIVQDRYVFQQARGYGLGSPREIAFTLDPAAPALSDRAPGSAALRIGADSSISPLDHWLTILFGPGD